MKALGTGWSAGVTWQDFEVVRAEGEPPRLVLHGRAAELARERRMVRWLVALSHERTGAVASVVVEDTSPVTAAGGGVATGRRGGGGGGSGRPRPRARR